MFGAAVITASDRSSRGERVDASGPALAVQLERIPMRLVDLRVVPDTVREIRGALRSLVKDPEYRLTPDEMCGTCHREIKLNQQAHANHEPAVAGCVDCHVPLLNESRTAYSIHDHKFQFGPPKPEHVAGGDPCAACHERLRVKGKKAARGASQR